MAFFRKKRTVVVCVSLILDLAVAFIINKLSSDTFDFAATHNIVMCIIFIVLVLLLIIFKVAENNEPARSQRKKLQRAFQENGGYEAVVDEMKNCIKKHDLKSMKDLKKMVDMIEK